MILFRFLRFLFFFVSLKPTKLLFVLVYPPFFTSFTSMFCITRGEKLC